MDIFQFKEYKKFTLKRIEAMPKRGYGQLKRLSEYIRVNSTFLSQVFKGPKQLNLDQAILVCDFFGLTDIETRYYIKLVEIDRAGSKRLSSFFESELQQIKVKAQKISNRLNIQQVLPDTEKAIFYSEWYYSAIRLITGVKGFQDVDSIADHFGLTRKLTNDVISFLLQSGLLVKEKKGLRVGPSRTHLDSSSPFIKLHHSNWRNKAIEDLRYEYSENVHYSSPMTVGKDDVDKIKSEILKLIEEVGRIVDPAPTEELMCLNIDWFKVSPNS